MEKYLKKNAKKSIMKLIMYCLSLWGLIVLIPLFVGNIIVDVANGVDVLEDIKKSEGSEIITEISKFITKNIKLEELGDMNPKGLIWLKVFFYGITAIFALIILTEIFLLISGKYKKVYKYSKAKALTYMSMEDIEKEFRESDPYGKNLRISKNFTWAINHPRMLMFINEDLLWVYEDIEETKYSAYGILTYFKTKKHYLNILEPIFGSHAIKMKPMDVKSALAEYFANHKHVINGYSDEIARMASSKKRRGELLYLVADRKRKQKEIEEQRKEYFYAEKRSEGESRFKLK